MQVLLCSILLLSISPIQLGWKMHSTNPMKRLTVGSTLNRSPLSEAIRKRMDSKSSRVVYPIFKELDFSTSLVDVLFTETALGRIFQLVQTRPAWTATQLIDPPHWKSSSEMPTNQDHNLNSCNQRQDPSCWENRHVGSINTGHSRHDCPDWLDVNRC